MLATGTCLSGKWVSTEGGGAADVRRATAEDAQGSAHANSVFGEPVRAGGLMNNTMFMPWAKAGKGQLSVTQQGTGKPWLTVQSVAAVALKAPFSAGYTIKKTVTPVEQADKGLFGGGQCIKTAVPGIFF